MSEKSKQNMELRIHDVHCEWISRNNMGQEGTKK